MSNNNVPGSNQNVNVQVRALTIDPAVTVQYKTKILHKNVVNGVNTLTQAMMNETNTKYVIKYDYVLGEDITVPANCVLEFDGGSISGAYTINYNNCTITGIPSINCQTEGLLKNTNLNITYFGCVGDGVTDNSAIFTHIISTYLGANFYVPDGTFVIANQVNIHPSGTSRGDFYIYGNGRSSVIKVTYEGVAFMFGYVSGQTNQRLNTEICNIRIVGIPPENEVPRTRITDPSLLSKTSFIKAENGTYIQFAKIDNVHFDSLNEAVHFDTAYWTRISNSYFDNCVIGLWLGEANSSSVLNCGFRGIYDRGIVYAPSHKYDGTIKNKGGNGILISGNDFSDCRYAGIHVAGQLTNASINGNYFECESTDINGNTIGRQIQIGEPSGDNKGSLSDAKIQSSFIKANRGLLNYGSSDPYRTGIINYGTYTGNLGGDFVKFEEGSSGRENLFGEGITNIDVLGNNAFRNWYDENGREFKQGFLEYFSSKVRVRHYYNVCIPANSYKRIDVESARYFKFLFYQSRVAGVTLLMRDDNTAYVGTHDEEQGTWDGIASMTDERGLWDDYNYPRLMMLYDIKNIQIYLINTTNDNIVTDVELKYLVNTYHK